MDNPATGVLRAEPRRRLPPRHRRPRPDLPAGRRRARAFIDTRDIGAAAAAVFADPEPHRGRGYTLTGPRAVTFDEVAAILTTAFHRTITYQPATVFGYADHLRRRGLPAVQIAVQTVLHTGLRRGDAQTVDPTLAPLLGRPAHTIEEYVNEHMATWTRP